MVISLTGLVALQASLLADAFASKEASFRRNVQAALGSIAGHLETAETVSATLHVVGDNTEIVIATHGTPGTICLPDTISVPRYSGTRRIVQANIEYFWHHESGMKNRLVDTPLFFSRSFDPYTERIDTMWTRIPTSETDSNYLFVHYTLDSTGDLSRTQVDSGGMARLEVSDSSRIGIITRVMDRLVSDQALPIEKRVDRDQLDSLVEAILDEYGVELDPVYGILQDADTSLYMQHPEGFADELRESDFHAALFPNDILAAPARLIMYFPDRGAYLFRQIGPMLAATIGFMLVVVFGFTYTVRTLVAQRRASRQMVDFVNNMTHEFKTPISTVALACEAILRRDVVVDTDRVSRFSRMIHDENRRMRHQVDKILQMAALEETEDHLQLTAVDVHNVVQNAVDGINLQVQKRDGRVECRLDSRHPVIPADEVHLTGIIYNLLDNANKYSAEAPDIVVSTSDTPNGLTIVVQDHGLGLSPEDARQVFDKYFRVTRGNVHDVKGFGLGLSYVSLMVKAHGGEITVDSSLGKGTRMVVQFPRPASDDIVKPGSNS